MNYLVDFENTGVLGLEGLNSIRNEDVVEVFYSDKSNKIDIGIISLIQECSGTVKFYKTEKSAPNYLDFWITCRASQILNTSNHIAIISKDKGYISVRDFYGKEDRQVILSETVLEAFQKRERIKNASDIMESIEKETETLVAEENQESSDATKETHKEVKTVFPKTMKSPTKNNKNKVKQLDNKTKVISRVCQTKCLSADDKYELKEALKNLPKHNGRLQQVVIDCFEDPTCKTLGDMHFKVINEVGRKDGEEAYRIIEEKFKKIKGFATTKV